MSAGQRDPDDLSAFCCHNPDCPDYGQRGRGNLTVPMRYGPQQRRLLRCRTCKARFSERKGALHKNASFQGRIGPPGV